MSLILKNDNFFLHLAVFLIMTSELRRIYKLISLFLLFNLSCDLKFPYKGLYHKSCPLFCGTDKLELETSLQFEIVY